MGKGRRISQDVKSKIEQLTQSVKLLKAELEQHEQLSMKARTGIVKLDTLLREWPLVHKALEPVINQALDDNGYGHDCRGQLTWLKKGKEADESSSLWAS